MTSAASGSHNAWPYALKPPNSVGAYRGVLYPRFLGDILCWDAQGETQRLFDCEIKPTILDFLKNNSSRIQESDSFLLLTLFMVGKRPERSKPVVMFVGDDKAARKEAFDLVKESDIMASYSGFELGHTEFGKVMALAGELVAVFSTREDGAGCRQLFRAPTKTEQPSKATAGGVVIHQGKHMFLTVNHFLDDTPVQPVARGKKEEEIPECEITGLSDFDDDDSDTTSQGSLSDDPDGEDSEKDGSIVSSGSPVYGQDPASPAQAMLEHPCVEVGKAIIRSRELDYALVEVDADVVDIAALCKEALLLDNTFLLEWGPRVAAVKTKTSDGGTIGGTMSGNSHYIRLPRLKAFTEVYMARFSRPLRSGDCGCWVRDAVTGRFFGHIIAGSPTDGMAVIMPAWAVFEHARLLLANAPTAVQPEGPTILSTGKSQYPSKIRNEDKGSFGLLSTPLPCLDPFDDCTLTPMDIDPTTSMADKKQSSQPYRAPATSQPGYPPPLQAANSPDRGAEKPLCTPIPLMPPTLSSALIRNLPLNTSEESLRLMMLFSRDLIDVEVFPIEQSADAGFRSGILKFKSLVGAQEAKNMLDGRPNISNDAEIVVEILGNASPTTLGKRFHSDTTISRGVSNPMATMAPSALFSRQTSQFNGTVQSPDKISPSENVMYGDSAAYEAGTTYQNLFEPYRNRFASTQIANTLLIDTTEDKKTEKLHIHHYQIAPRLNYSPPPNPAGQNPPCNTLYVGNLPIDTSEEELKAMFSRQRGYKRLCFRTKQNGPMCFVEFDDVAFATKAMHELYGQPLSNSDNGGIRLSFSKNPLGVRSSQKQGQNGAGAMGAVNGTYASWDGGFATANGPSSGLSAPPGPGASHGGYTAFPNLVIGTNSSYTAPIVSNASSNLWGQAVYPYNGNGNGPKMSGTTSAFLPYMTGR